MSDTPALVNALVKNVTPELGSRLLGRMFKQRVEDVFENGIPEYFLDSLEGTNYVCKIGVNGSGDIEFNLDPTRKKFANQVKNRAKNAELDKLPEIIAAINRYQAVAYLSDFNADLRMELEAELKKRRRTLYELGVGQTMLRKLDGGNVENYVRFLDQFLYTYDGVTNDIDEELEMELATLKGMIRHAQKVERRKGIPVIDTMLILLDNTGYHELNQTQLLKLGNFIHQQQLNAMGIG